MKKQNHTRLSILHAFALLYLLPLLLRPVHFVAAQPANGNMEGLPNANFKPSMSITISVLIVALVFVAFFSIFIRQCTRDNLGGGNVGAPVGARRSRRAARGLDPTVVGEFPTFIYSAVKGLKIGKGALECAVCLNEFEDDETLRLLPKCDHVFHPECIDLWLSSHVTCPVCRANLVPKSGDETDGAEDTEARGSDTEPEGENPSSQINESRNQVSITVSDDQIAESQAEAVNDAQTVVPNRPVRSKSLSAPRFPAKFPRSHTTGHSLLQPGEDRERFTLRLPDDIRKQILSRKLNRTTSCVTFPTRQGSVSGESARRGYRTGGEGSSRGRNYLFGMFDWSSARPEGGMFSRTRSFFRRTPSVTLGKRVDGSVKSPFDCIGPQVDGDEQPSPARPTV